MTKFKRHHLILSDADITELRRRVADPSTIEAKAWEYHRTHRCDAYLDDAPNPVQRSGSGDYPELDADSRKCRNLAVGYAATGDMKYAAAASWFLLRWRSEVDPYAGDEQAAYHQAYGAFSFAFAFDLIRPTIDAAMQSEYESWFRRWSDAYKVMEDRWATNYYFSNTKRYPYEWANPQGLTYDRQDWYEGRDATLAPMAAWLACATVSGYNEHARIIFNEHRLKLPTILHSACAPDNDGDGQGTVPAPSVQVWVSSQDYITYHARLASMLVQMAGNWGQTTSLDWYELEQTWEWISQFAPPAKSPNGGVFTPSLYWSRAQMAKRMYGLPMVTTSELYESQFLGPVALTQLS